MRIVNDVVHNGEIYMVIILVILLVHVVEIQERDGVRASIKFWWALVIWWGFWSEYLVPYVNQWSVIYGDGNDLVHPGPMVGILERDGHVLSVNGTACISATLCCELHFIYIYVYVVMNGCESMLTVIV